MLSRPPDHQAPQVLAWGTQHDSATGVDTPDTIGGKHEPDGCSGRRVGFLHLKGWPDQRRVEDDVAPHPVTPNRRSPIWSWRRGASSERSGLTVMSPFLTCVGGQPHCRANVSTSLTGRPETSARRALGTGLSP